MGPLRAPAGSTPVSGMVRLVEPGGATVWLVAQVPEAADARVLKELGLAAVAVEQPNDTARMLAAGLRCCWADPLDAPWPGVDVPGDMVIGVFRELTGGREEASQHRAAVAALRRLHAAGWLLFDEVAWRVRLGPRVALWSPADLSVLRQLWRSMTPPPPGPGRGDAE